jgi:hypothetical protein
MCSGRPTPLVVLTAEERQLLDQWARHPPTAEGLAQHACLVLASAPRETNGESAAAPGETGVGKRHRAVRNRLPVVWDEPWPRGAAPRSPMPRRRASSHERASQAVQVDEDGRRHPGGHSAFLSSNLQFGTLDNMEGPACRIA